MCALARSIASFFYDLESLQVGCVLSVPKLIIFLGKNKLHNKLINLREAVTDASPLSSLFSLSPGTSSVANLVVHERKTELGVGDIT